MRALLPLLAGLGVIVPGASASSYSNPSALDLPEGMGPVDDNAPASIYPSTISVSGLPGHVVKATVTVRGISHLFPSDIDALLVAPSGAKSLLFSDVCGGSATPFSATDLTLDDEATSTFPELGQGPCPSGSYRPADSQAIPADPFPAPAPSGPFTATMANFTGGSPNGAWGLFVMDDDFDEGGRIDGGWSLDLLPAARCAGKSAALSANVGTAGRDVLTGTPRRDVMLGLGGNDRITGLGGGDVICGGAGNDKIFGGPGKDLLRGEAGRDGLKGQGGKRHLRRAAASQTRARGCEKAKSI